MAKPLVVDLFAEDYAHEAFLSAMIRRIALTEDRPVALRTRWARGGHGRALAELAVYQRMAQKGQAGLGLPDVLVVVIDANCQTVNKARKTVEAKIEHPFKDRTVVACPDPHVERWFLADPASFAQVVGGRPKVGRRKCQQDVYKRILKKAIVDAGHPVSLGGAEFAEEIVNAMDLYRAGKGEKSLKLFVDAFTGYLKSQ
jgi:hypothetical protein